MAGSAFPVAVRQSSGTPEASQEALQSILAFSSRYWKNTAKPSSTLLIKDVQDRFRTICPALTRIEVHKPGAESLPPGPRLTEDISDAKK